MEGWAIRRKVEGGGERAEVRRIDAIIRVAQARGKIHVRKGYIRELTGQNLKVRGFQTDQFEVRNESASD